MTVMLQKRLPLLGAVAVAVLGGGGAAVAALLDQAGAWDQMLLAASVVSLAVLGLEISVRLGDLLGLEQGEATRARSDDERRHGFEQAHARWRRRHLEYERWRLTVGRPVPAELLVSERPAVRDFRATPGNWKGHLILWASWPAIGTLEEHTTGFTMLLQRLPMEGHREEPRTRCGPPLDRRRVPAVRDALDRLQTIQPLRRQLAAHDT